MSIISRRLIKNVVNKQAALITRSFAAAPHLKFHPDETDKIGKRSVSHV